MLDTGQLPLTGDTLLWFQQGLNAAASSEYERAVAFFNRVVQVRPDYYEAWYERGLVLERLGCYAEAILSYDRALEAEPKSEMLAEIWHDRGNALQYGLGHYEAALTCYDRVVQIDTHHDTAWLNRGNALFYGLNQIEEAISSYTRSLFVNPDNALTWRNRGNALVELKRYAEAVASYDRALVLQPDDQVARQARALASQQMGLAAMSQPTTNPAWYGQGYIESTYVEGEETTGQPLDNDLNSASKLYQKPTLVIQDDWGQREILLDLEQYTIGRDPKNTVCLHSQFASRYHATLIREVQPDGSLKYYILDGTLAGKPSTNGLLVNGHRQQRCELKNEDVVVFGPNVRATYYTPLGN